MALYQDMEKLIEERQNALKNYQGDEFFEKYAELMYMKRSFRKDFDWYDVESLVDARQKYERFKSGDFHFAANYIITFKRRLELFYKKTNMPTTELLPDITLAEDGKEVQEEEQLRYFIEEKDLDDENAKKFRNKLFEKGYPVTVLPTIDDTSFLGRSFAEHIRRTNNDFPMTPDALFLILTEKTTSDIEALGGEVNPLNDIRINGLSIEEAWGKKYENIEDPEQKKTQMKADLLNAILHGSEEISLVRKVAKKNEKGEIQFSESGRVVLVQSRKNLEKTRNFLQEVDKFHQVYTQHAPFLSEPGVAPYPSSQKYLNEMRLAGEKLAVKSNLDNNATSSYEDFKNAYNEYVLNVKAFLSYQLMEMQMTKENYERSLRQGQNLNAAQKDALKNDIKSTADKMKALQSRFEEHLAVLESSFNRVDARSKGISVTTADDPWKRKKDFTFLNLMNAHRQSAMLRGLDPDVMDIQAKTTLPQNHAWVNDLGTLTPLNENQRRQILENSPINFKSPIRLSNGESIVTMTDENGTSADSLLRDRGFVPRMDTFQSLFCIWAMAEKNLSLKEASRLYKAHIPIGQGPKGENIYPENHETVKQYEKEFLDFCKRNPFAAGDDILREEVQRDVNGPLRPNNDPDVQQLFKEKMEKSIRNWMNVFQKGSQIANQYTIPDIDFSDPEQVRPYADEFNLIRGIGVDGKQESDRMLENEGNTKYFDAIRVAGDAIGEKKYYIMYQNFFHMMNLMDVVYNKPYCNEGPGIPKNALAAGEVAFYQENAGQVMSDFKGKTLGDVLTNHAGTISAYNITFTLEFQKKFIMNAGPGNNFNVQPAEPGGDVTADLPVKDGVAYLLHQNKNVYASFVEKERKEMVKRSAKKDLHNDISVNMLEAREVPMSAALRNELINLGSAASMQDFLFNKFEGELTGKDVIAKCFRKMVPRNFHGDFLKEGIRNSDFFLINDVKPSELWGKKYEGIQNEDQREWLYRTEIMKAIAQGNSVIKVRMFQHDSLGKLKETKPITLYKRRENMLRLSQNYKDYRVGKANLYSILTKVRDELISTQENPDANFYDNTRTGSTLYQEFCKSLKEAIAALENTNTTASVMQQKIENLNTAATNYGKSREGLIGPRTDAGVLRLKNAWKITGDGNSHYSDRILTYYMGIRSGLNDDLVIDSPDVTVKDDIPESKLHNGISTMNTGIGGTVINLGGDEDRFCRERIEANLRRVKRHPDYINRANTSVERQNAIKYLMSYFDAKTAEPLNGAQRPELKLIIAQKADEFWYDVDRLSKDKAFQRFMKEDPEGCIKKWESIEEAAENTRKENKNWIKRHITDTGRTGLEYVAKIRDLNGPSAVETIRNNQNNQREMASYYVRLCDLIYAQILSSNTDDARQIRSELARGTLTKENLKNQIRQSVLADNLLTGRNLNKMEGRLESLSTSKDLAKAVRRSVISIRQNAETEKERRIQQQVVGMMLVLDANHDGIIQQEEWNRFLQGTNLNVAEHAEDKLAEAGRRFDSPLHVRVKVKEEGQPEREEERDVNPDMKALIPSVGLSLDRTISLQRNFIVWTMGHENMSFEDAVRICNTVPRIENGAVVNQAEANRADQLRYDFYQFVKDHPVKSQAEVPEDQREAKRAEFRKNYRQWTRVFAKATENMKKYRLPDINYRNLDEVKQHLDTLCLVSAIGTEVGQEMNKMFHTSTMVNGENIARQEIGNKAFQEIGSFWWNLSDSLRAVSKGFQNIPQLNEHPLEKVRSIMKATAVMRDTAMNDLQEYKGFNLGEIADKAEKEGKIPNHGKAVDDLFTEYYTNSGRVDFSDRETVEFLQGKTNGTFSGKAKKMVDGRIRDNIGDFRESYLKGIEEFRNSLFANAERIHLREILASLPAKTEIDAKVMRDELDRPVPDGNGATLRDVVNSLFHSITAGGVTGPVLHNQGLSVTDLFRVDGEPFKEDYSVRYKYDNVESDALKEDIFRVELLKKIMSGNHDISIRSFDMLNSKIRETAPIGLFPRKDYVRESAEALRQLQEAVQDMHNDLLAYKVKLQATQLIPNANFEPGVDPEGSREYKDLVQCLKNAIRATRNAGKDSTREDVERALGNLASAAERYYDTHTGFFGGEPGSDNGKIRYHASDDMKKDAHTFRRRYHRFMQKVNTDVLGNGGKQLHDIDLETAEKLLVKTAGMQGAANRILPPDRCRTIYLLGEMRYARANFKADYAENELPRALRDIPRGDAEAAIGYLNSLWTKKISDNTVTYTDIRNAVHPNDLIKDLAKNEVFLRTYRENAKNCVNNWETVEQRSTQMLEKNRTWGNTVRRNFGSLSAFVAGFDKINPEENGGPKRDLTIDQICNAVELEEGKNADTRTRLYYRLAETTVRGIMTSDTEIGRRLRYEDAVSPYVSREQEGFLAKFIRKVAMQYLLDEVLGDEKRRDTIRKLESANNPLWKETEKMIQRENLLDISQINHILNIQGSEFNNNGPELFKHELDLEELEMDDAELDRKLRRRGDYLDNTMIERQYNVHAEFEEISDYSEEDYTPIIQKRDNYITEKISKIEDYQGKGRDFFRPDDDIILEADGYLNDEEEKEIDFDAALENIEDEYIGEENAFNPIYKEGNKGNLLNDVERNYDAEFDELMQGFEPEEVRIDEIGLEDDNLNLEDEEPELQDEKPEEKKDEMDGQKGGKADEVDSANAVRFLSENTEKPKTLKEIDYINIRKRVFILAYGAEVLHEKGLKLTRAELDKQERQWLSKEPYMSILDRMVKDNTNKELLDLIQSHRVPEEVARIQEGRPKPVKENKAGPEIKNKEAGEKANEAGGKGPEEKPAGPAMGGPK